MARTTKPKPVVAAEPVEPPLEIDIRLLEQSETKFYICGTSPLVFHQMAQKAWGDLLYPRGPLTGAAKRLNLKHDPLSEYRASIYRRPDYQSGPTRLLFPAGAFKRAIAQTALDIPGVAKAQIDRLTWVAGDFIDIWGRPVLLMDIVRLADQKRTADVHTWACCPRWATEVSLHWVSPHLSHQSITNLLVNAGMITGIGDGRQQKGHYSRGQWRVCNADDPEFLAIVAEGGMAAQDAALKNPEFFNDQTAEMFEWFGEEFNTRARTYSEPPADSSTRPPTRRKRSGNGATRRPRKDPGHAAP